MLSQSYGSSQSPSGSNAIPNTMLFDRPKKITRAVPTIARGFALAHQVVDKVI
jgi:hypothetical protein